MRNLSDIEKVGIGFGGLLVLFFVFASPSKESISTAPLPPTPLLQPEMVVSPVPDKFLVACLTKPKLEELIGHSVAHERTKFNAMFTNMDCVQIPPTERYKVLSVQNHMVEIVNVTAKLITSEGMWAVEEAFAPAK